MKKTLLTIALVMATFSAAHAQQNPFGARSAPSQQTPAQQAPTLDDEAPSKPMITLPAPARAVFRQVADWQRELNRFLGGKLRESSDQGSWVAALTVLLASFLYGVLHAAGPGHGRAGICGQRHDALDGSR